MGLINGHKKMCGTGRLDKTKHACCARAVNPDRACACIRVAGAEGESSHRSAGVQLFEQLPCGIGPRYRERKIGQRGGPHRCRTRGTAKFRHHHQDFGKTAFVAARPEGRHPLPDELGPDRRDVIRRPAFFAAACGPMRFEKPAQGIPKHLGGIVARKPGRIHGRRCLYALPYFGLRFSLNDMVASLWSAVSNVTCSSAIEASSIIFTRSLTIWLIDSFVQRMAQVGPLASSIAISRALFSTSTRGTTW